MLGGTRRQGASSPRTGQRPLAGFTTLNAIDLSSARCADIGLIERRSFMSVPSAVRALPAFPSLEQQKKQARELLVSAKAGDARALERFRSHHPKWSASDGARQTAPLSLHAAHLVIAREYGFATWSRLKAQDRKSVV